MKVIFLKRITIWGWNNPNITFSLFWSPEEISITWSVSFSIELINQLNGPEKIEFTKTDSEENVNAPRFTVTLGVMPDYMFDGEGMRIDGVREGKPAQTAGIQAGDIVVQMGDIEVVDMMSYMKALSNFQKGDETIVKAKRGKKVKKFKVKF